MKKLFLATTMLAVSVVAASAADMAPRYTKAAPMPAPIFTWTGFYIGGNVGYGWDDRSASLVAPDAASVAFFGPALAAGALPSFYNPNPRGIVGGGQAGYNWQTSNIVFGVEADFQGADVKGTDTRNTTGVPGFVPITAISSEKLDWYGTFRGRLGYAVNTALFYVTGGLAYGHVSHSFFTQAPSAPAAATQIAAGTSSDTYVGYAVGAGVEWAFNNNWSVKGEYMYMDLGSHNTSAVGVIGTPVAATLLQRNRDEFHTVRVGLNYRFGGPVVAKY